MNKTKVNWPDHPAVGVEITVQKGGDDRKVQIIDVKSGPMLANFEPDATDIVLRGTLQLLVKDLLSGAVEWLPPTDGQVLLDWISDRKIREKA